ncbi:hypothetical protein [Pararhodobacter sp.]|uniref:hypothetical protein n=1 Tax=Pararhodobacter sp. TaxID=2127056 RepID=UPI002FDEBFE0
MFRRFIPPVCAGCGALIPRAAAGRCPACRKDFTSAVSTGGIAPRHPAMREKERIAAPRDPKRLP